MIPTTDPAAAHCLKRSIPQSLSAATAVHAADLARRKRSILPPKLNPEDRLNVEQARRLTGFGRTKFLE